MSLLKEREIARRRLESAAKNLLDCQNFNMTTKAPEYIRLCKKRAISARKKLNSIERKICKVHNNAISPQLEFMAKLMIIFKPEIKDEIESFVTFT